MRRTLSQFHGEKIHVLSFFHGTGIFLLTFCISMALGVMFGLGGSLMLKHSELGRFHEIESCLVTLLAYTSYFFSNALTMSGIVSLLFCGITLKHYAYHNMSPRTQRTTRYMFGILAQLSENFIFIYLGLSLFTSTRLVYKPVFILFTAVRDSLHCLAFRATDPCADRRVHREIRRRVSHLETHQLCRASEVTRARVGAGRVAPLVPDDAVRLARACITTELTSACAASGQD